MDIKEECMYRSKKNILYAMCVYIIGFCILLLCIAAILVLILDASSLNTAPGGVIGGMAVILIFIVFGWGALGFILSFLCEKIMCYETFCTIRWVNWRFQIATYKLNYDEIMGYKMNIPSKGPRSFSFKVQRRGFSLQKISMIAVSTKSIKKCSEIIQSKNREFYQY